MFNKAIWINTGLKTGDAVPEYRGSWRLPEGKKPARAELRITALGVYAASLNGRRVGDFELAPGWTAYDRRLQVQAYDVTDLLAAENDLRVRVGKGWYASPMPGFNDSDDRRRRMQRQTALIAELEATFDDGTMQTFATGADWTWVESPIRFSEIYDGEVCDATFEDAAPKPCAPFDGPTDRFIPQEGEPIVELERVAARRVFTTPRGETVVDFGQEVTGCVQFTVDAHAGDAVRLRHGEVLDAEGNFYNANYRSAKAELIYTCREGRQTWRPELTFFGFRYVRLDSFPGAPTPEQFTAVVLCSRLRQTGFVRTGHPGINRLVSNVLWGQKGNFLDVPTDCPQRDERLGWTGDAQVFCRAATLNFDTERFFTKWLRDMAADQRPNGSIGIVVPDYLPGDNSSAAWGDAATICPWTVYQTYGGLDALGEHYGMMEKWVDYITSATTTPNLWTGGEHFADWLGLDAPAGSYKGSTREDFIASAFYAHSADLTARAARALGRDGSKYEALHGEIVRAFREAFGEYRTQTEHILALEFGLAPDPEKTAADLAAMIRRDGVRLRTGFVGTPYMLHVLSRYGYGDLAWSLLLREDYPSWLYPISKGATTIWEHWDGIMPDGGFWSADMNSFNHYAYGSVIDWIYEVAAGIRHDESHPGFTRAIFAPTPDARLGFLDVTLETRAGRLSSKWTCTPDGVRYEIETAVPALVRIDGAETEVGPGRYTFWGK